MSDPNTNPAPAPAPTPAPAPKPAAAPPKPAAKPAAGKTRRAFNVAAFMSWVAVGWLTMTASLLGMVFGTIRFLFPNVLSEPPSQIKVKREDWPVDGEVVNSFKDQNFWLVRYGGKIYALSTTCTHLGCTPNWLEREQKFKCPCHGSGFKITGINFEGPAPRPLERWGVSVAEDGQILVDKSKKFQEERGEWLNPESFIKA